MMLIYMFSLFFFNKTAVGTDHLLLLGAEPPAGLCHGVPGEAGHGPGHLCLQGLRSVVRRSVDLLLKNASHKIVQGIAVWAAGRP